MIPLPKGGSFVVIGENIHATRTLARSGPLILSTADGAAAIRFPGRDGEEHLLPVHDAIRAGSEFGAGRVKHVKSAILTGLDAGPEAQAARDYVRSMAIRQARAGADYLDLNVDEAAADSSIGVAAMRWLVEAVAAATAVEDATAAAISIDSSDPAVIQAGLAASNRRAGPALLNSSSLDRLDVLDLAAREGCPVIVSATGARSMPSSADERVENASRMVDAALSCGLTLAGLYLDPLVLPVGVEPEAGLAFLEAVRRLRATFGPEIHLTGGLSNVSFGLPARRLLNDVFIDLAVEAGADSGVIDPIANDPARVFAQDRSSEPYRLAAAVLTGDDPYGGDYLAAFRAGRLAPQSSDVGS